MTQGFDEYWDKENIRFDDSYHKHKETYDLGAASRQAEVDSLKIELNGSNERAAMTLNHKNKMVDRMQAEIDELQKRIDDALADIKQSGVMYGFSEELYSVMKILKGDSNE